MKLKVTSVFPAVAILLAGTACAAEPLPRGIADPVLGRWDLTVRGQDGDYPSWLEIRPRTEAQLMAEFVGQFGSKRHAARLCH